MSRGNRPYPGIHPMQLNSFLERNGRLQPPRNCPDFVWAFSLTSMQLKKKPRDKVFINVRIAFAVMTSCASVGRSTQINDQPSKIYTTFWATFFNNQEKRMSVKTRHYMFSRNTFLSQYTWSVKEYKISFYSGCASSSPHLFGDVPRKSCACWGSAWLPKHFNQEHHRSLLNRPHRTHKPQEVRQEETLWRHRFERHRRTAGWAEREVSGDPEQRWWRALSCSGSVETAQSWNAINETNILFVLPLFFFLVHTYKIIYMY